MQTRIQRIQKEKQSSSIREKEQKSFKLLDPRWSRPMSLPCHQIYLWLCVTLTFDLLARPQSWPLHALSSLTTCVSWHQNRFTRFLKYCVHKFGSRQTNRRKNGQINGRVEHIMSAPAISSRGGINTQNIQIHDNTSQPNDKYTDYRIQLIVH